MRFIDELMWLVQWQICANISSPDSICTTSSKQILSMASETLRDALWHAGHQYRLGPIALLPLQWRFQVKQAVGSNRPA